METKPVKDFTTKIALEKEFSREKVERLLSYWRGMKTRSRIKNHPGLCETWILNPISACVYLSKLEGVFDIPRLYIDRINTLDQYRPGNIRFATPKQNSRNRIDTKYIIENGNKISLSNWMERETGLYKDTATKLYEAIKARINEKIPLNGIIYHIAINEDLWPNKEKFESFKQKHPDFQLYEDLGTILHKNKSYIVDQYGTKIKLTDWMEKETGIKAKEWSKLYSRIRYFFLFKNNSASEVLCKISKYKEYWPSIESYQVFLSKNLNNHD